MWTATMRLRRYLESELGDARPEDVQNRLEELDTIQSVLSEDRIQGDLDLLGSLGNETRYKLVRLLAAADGELCVCELRGLVDASESTISHALSDLADAGLVRRRKDGRWRKYRATNAAVAIVSMMDGVGTGD